MLPNIFPTAILKFPILTNSIGLISAGSTFFERISNRKFKYSVNVLLITGTSILVSSIGLDAIVALSSKLLGGIYPITIVLILMNLFYNNIPNKKSFRYTVYITLAMSVLMVIGDLVPMIREVLSIIPLYEAGFPWVIPAIAVFLITNIKINTPETKEGFSSI